MYPSFQGNISDVSLIFPLICQRIVVHTVPLNCNFIFPHVILRGTTTILQCIPVTCLHGPRLLVSCNVHVSWKYTCGNTRLVEINAWKYMSHGSTRMEVDAWKVYVWNKRHVLTCRNLPIESIALYYINILLVNQHNVTYGLFRSTYIKSWWISSGAWKFRVKSIIFRIKLMCLVTNLKQFYCLAHMHELNWQRNGKWLLP